ncbi:MAG: heparinase II/III family protein [Rhizobiaceae bacterium]|nr:heparinase II/III family protein [Rhizobiaceae bacterium]
MTMISDQPRAFGQLIAEGASRTARIFRPDLLLSSLTQSTPKELVLVPQDLRTTDALLAQEYYNGVYSFAEQRVDTGGKNPFRLEIEGIDTSINWQNQLHSFRWLRHLSASQNAISNSHAQSLLRDWIAEWGKPRTSIAWQPEIAAQRLLSWLYHSVVIVDQVDIGLYKKFLKSIGVHIGYLNNNLATTTDGLPKLQVRLALAYAALCVRMNRKLQSTSARKPHEALGKILSQQIFADGGHVSRCPSVLPEIMVDLLPLRQAYERLGIAPPNELLSAIDRMMPAIRYYRHRDGNFARFNGVSYSRQDLISTVLRYDDAMGEPTQEATQSGYQRLTGGPTTVIIDVGKPPKGENSNKAHAGCLSFEMSSLRTCFITNCGAPELGNDKLIAASRSTAAHSTAVIHNTSSCRFHQGGIFKHFLGGRVLAGPSRVSCERKVLNGYTQIIARHDGYLRQFGVWHERIIQLSDDGNLLFGRDRFFANGGKSPKHMTRDDCAIRFHLHPSVSANIVDNSGAIVIAASENQNWKFSCDGGNIALEESIFFANPGGSAATSQIVINLNLAELNEVNWRFEQTIGTRFQ